MNGCYACTMHLPFVFYLKCSNDNGSHTHKKSERVRGRWRRREHRNATSALTLQHYIEFTHNFHMHTCVHCTYTHTQSATEFALIWLELFHLYAGVALLCSSSFLFLSFYLSSGLCVCMFDCSFSYNSSSDGDGRKSSCICLNFIVTSISTIHFIFE